MPVGLAGMRSAAELTAFITVGLVTMLLCGPPSETSGKNGTSVAFTATYPLRQVATATMLPLEITTVTATTTITVTAPVSASASASASASTSASSNSNLRFQGLRHHRTFNAEQLRYRGAIKGVMLFGTTFGALLMSYIKPIRELYKPISPADPMSLSPYFPALEISADSAPRSPS